MPSSTPAPLPDAAARGRLLLVEDEFLLAEELSHRLEKMGYVVIDAVPSADTAIKVARSARPDLILMDVRLRGATDGIEAAAAITAELDVPIVFLTSHSDETTLRRALAVSPFGYLLKPLHERELRIGVAMALRTHALERRLREEEERHRATLSSISDAVVATDVEGRVTYMNPAAEQLTGWTLGEARLVDAEQVVRLVGRDVASRAHPLTRARISREPQGARPDTVLVQKDGRAVPVLDRAAPLTLPSGTVDGAVLLCRDLSGHGEAAADAAGAMERERQAQKMEAIGRLAGGLAHDLNNMLTVASGYIELLLRDPTLTMSQRGMIEQIDVAAARSADLTRQLLAFSRRQILRPERLQLNAVVDGMVPMLRRLLGEDIELRTALDPALSGVNADVGQLQQVLMNLAESARDAMPVGGVLSFDTRDVELDEAYARQVLDLEPGRYVQLSVSDTGSGLDAATRARMFEPFFTSQELGRGSGLGLATAYGIVRQSGGHIHVDSRPGAGTTFVVHLPAVSSPSAAVPMETIDPPGGSEHILLVEDDPAVRSVARRFLESRGYVVHEAADGQEALALAGSLSRPIDLLLTDAVMPGMSGRVVAEQLTARVPDLPVVYMSGYTPDGILRHGIESEGATFVQKPFTSRRLLAAVRSTLDARRGPIGQARSSQ